MGEGESYEQPCEGVINKVDKHKVWNDVNEVEHKINKTGFKFGHLKYLHVSKEVPTRQHYGETPHRPFRENQHAGVSL